MKIKKTARDTFRRLSVKSKRAVQQLLANPEFQKEIETFRIKWGIELNNPQRIENIKKLRSNAFVYSDKLSSQASDDDFLIVYQDNKEYYQDLAAILKKFKLDIFYWIVFAWKYAKYNTQEPIEMYSETIPYIRLGRSEFDNKMPKIVIELGSNSTLRDVKNAWCRVQELREMLKLKPHKFQEWENFDRDLKIYRLYENGKSIAEISTILQEEDGVDLDYGNIKKIVTTFRQRVGLKKNKDKKLITRKTGSKEDLELLRLLSP